MPTLFLIAGIICIDQLLKSYIQQTMVIGASLPIITDIFHITYILNPGAAFGILENQRIFFILIAIMMICVVGYIYPKIPAKDKFLRFGIALLVGGAIGNVIDRIKLGYVVDFLDFRIWPVFNFADITIVSGVGIIIYSVWFLSNIKDENNECK
ncbi:signal peptidase II [Anaerosinus massiliensis]|uniref:signal peptidase II n=1 Tax=Massilibacillus massiliensis TaxID=1806837 RepID=UPI000A457A27|nr:signal peptidase II [Massilibacillus massiliensis]